MADVAHLTLLVALESPESLQPAELLAAVHRRAPGERGVDERVAQALTYWTHEGLLERSDPKTEAIYVPAGRREEASQRLARAGVSS
jgi:hypothetical protein